MATTTTPTSLQHKKRRTTYGKKSGTPTFSRDLQFFDDESVSYSHSNGSAKQSVEPHEINASVATAPRPHEVASQIPSAAPTKSYLIDKDAFEVSSSEDERVAAFIERPAFKRAKAKRSLVNDRHDPAVRTPRRVDKRPRLEGSSRKSVSFDDQPVHLPLPVHVKQAVDKSSAGAPNTQLVDQKALAGVTAFERLKYRQSKIDHDFEHDQQTNCADPAETTSQLSEDRTDKVPHNSSTRPASTTKDTRITNGLEARPKTSELSQLDSSRRAGQASDDVAIYELFSEPQSTVSVQALQHSDPTTPPRTSARSTITQNGSTSGLTPKQDRLWKDLFSDIGEPGNSNVSHRSGPATPRQLSAQRPKTSAQPSQSRLVDRLRATSLNQEQSDNSDERDSDIDKTEEFGDVPVQMTVVDSHTNPRRTATRSMATRLTYTQQRSHLAEDSVEDAMLLNLGPGLVSSSPYLNKRRHTSSTQNDIFGPDIDDADAGTTGVKIRSVHELRAQGRSSRALAEIDELLQDLKSSTPQAPRTIALVKLTQRLFDDDFTKSFIQCGHDISLLQAFAGMSDNLSRTVSTIASLLLLKQDLSDQALQWYKDALLGMTRMLSITTEVASLVTMQDTAVTRSSIALPTLFRKTRKLDSLWPESPPNLLSVRMLYLRATDLLVSKLRRSGDVSALLSDDDLIAMCPPGVFTNDTAEATIVISILESLSTLHSPSSWPPSLVENIALLPAAFSESADISQHTRFLAYRLCLNVTNDRTIDHFLFARAGTLQALSRSIVHGFAGLGDTPPDSAGQRRLHFDLLILAIGILINLSEYSKAARQAILVDPSASMLVEMIHIFRRGHEQSREAESEDESTSNVAYGYLAIMLANFCQEAQVRDIVVSHLENESLNTLVLAVEEFVQHHQRVDGTNFDGAEGRNVWSSFTERLKNVLARLKKHI